MDDWEVFPYEAAAVGVKAIEQGIAKIKYTREELLNLARKTIRHARDEIDLLMREGLIPPAPAE
jgi:malate dehydrogenase (oxaloacetate-decarboxylating)